MEIVAYEMHIKSSSSLSDIILALKNKGYEPELDLCQDEGVALKIKHPSGSKHVFKIKLYRLMADHKIFEIKSETKQEMLFMEEVLKSL